MKERRNYPTEEQFNLTRGLPTRNGILNSPVSAENAKTAINTNATKEEAGRLADRNNTVGHLRAEFFTPDNGKGNVLSVTEDPISGGVASRIRLSAAYTELASAQFAAEGALLHVTSGNPEQQAQRDAELVPTHTIYDLPFGTQVSYWSEVLESVDIYNATFEDFGDPDRVTIFAAENCIKERTGSSFRTSRSIALPHAHSVPVEHDSIVALPDGDPTMAPVNTEQKILERIGQRIGDQVFDGLSDTARGLLLDTMEGDDPNLKIRKRLVQPFGYLMKLPSDIGITDFAAFMEEHHRAYVKTADAIVKKLSKRNQKKIIPQPSYRLYLHKEDQGKGDISVIISPEFISHGGILEAAGLKLNRSVDVEPKHDPELVDGLMKVLKAGQDVPWYQNPTWQEVRAKVITRGNE